MIWNDGLPPLGSSRGDLWPDDGAVVMASYTGSAVTRVAGAGRHGDAHERTHASVIRRIRAEYAEMPGLALTLAQAVRLFGIEKETCRNILGGLVKTGYLRESAGRFLRV